MKKLPIELLENFEKSMSSRKKTKMILNSIFEMTKENWAKIMLEEMKKQKRKVKTRVKIP